MKNNKTTPYVFLAVLLLVWTQPFITFVYAAIPPTISDARQLKSDGITAIPEGSTTDESTVVFKARVTSPISLWK